MRFTALEMHRAAAVVLVLGTLVHVPALRAGPDPLDTLRSRFERDPGRGFEQALRTFREPTRRGDVAAMADIVALVGEWSQRCRCFTVHDHLAGLTATAAVQRGEWDVAADMYSIRGSFARSKRMAAGNPCMTSRALLFAQLAKEASAKAGLPLDGEIAKYLRGTKPPTDPERDGLAKQLPLPLRGLVLSSCAALARADDARAIADACKLLDGLTTLPVQQLGKDENAVYSNVRATMTLAMRFLGVLDGHEIAVRLQRVANLLPPEQLEGRLDFGRLAETCMVAWDGRHSVFLDTYYGCADRLLRAPQPSWQDINCLFSASPKMYQLGRQREATRTLSAIVAATLRMPAKDRNLCYRHYEQIIHPDTPEPLRTNILRLGLRGIAEDGVNAWGAWSAAIPSQAAADELNDWRGTFATCLFEASFHAKDSAKRVNMLEGACNSFRHARRHADADKVREFMEALGKDDPEALLRGALIRALGFSNTGQWREVAEALDPVLRSPGGKPSWKLVEATMLLARAKRETGQGRAAAARCQEALGLLNTVVALPVKRVPFQLQLAETAPTADLRVAALKEALRCAEAGGVDVLIEDVQRRLAEATLSGGDLEAAKVALLASVDRQESKRERLAFDPLLRRQWLADNLGVYRRLLYVAAKLGDVPLALETAEKMRSRALLDQLAWRKVDLGVRLPPKQRRQLEALREQRQRAYALLQQVSGFEPGGEQQTGNGVEALLGEGKQAPAVDAEKLKRTLDQLAAKEAALESAIRESYPAYRAATQVSIPTGDGLLRAARRTPRCAVLEYTFTHDGLVVVAVGPGCRPVVQFLDIPPNELLQHVESLRAQLQSSGRRVGTLSRELYGLLIEPVEHSLANADTLMVAADGALQLIPFGALQGSDGKYLAERRAIVCVPSLTAALSGRADRDVGTSETALVVAAPNTAPQEAMARENGETRAEGQRNSEREVSTVFDSLASAPLPGAKAEGEAIAARFADHTLLTAREATKAKLWAAGPKADILHVATHGYADPEVPEFSGLLLAGEGDTPYSVLTANEVYLWGLRARLVTLSACQTGLGKTVEGEGVLGLTRAFLYAGARDVLCSLWSVSDESTRKLMEAFYGAWRKGETAEEALQQAQLALLSDDATKHPFYWAPFIVVRGPR